MKHLRSVIFILFYCIALSLGMTGCAPRQTPALDPAPYDLTVYTCQEKEIYRPIVKEFKERTGLTVQVLSGTSKDLQEQIDAGILDERCDVVFGINAATLDSNRDRWEAYASTAADAIPDEFSTSGHLWTGFSVLTPVILYNTKVVTYRELPESWTSLLEPRWSGRVAFVDPEISDIYLTALVTAMHSSDNPSGYLEQFAANADYHTFSSISEVNAAVADGRCSLGVTLEAMAESLRKSGAEVDYIYPEEGTCALPDGSAVVAGCLHPEAAKTFIDFSVSKDVQQILVSDLNRRSVRLDVPPMPGLQNLEQLPVLPTGSVDFSDERRSALGQWRDLVLLRREEAGNS